MMNRLAWRKDLAFLPVLILALTTAVIVGIHALAMQSFAIAITFLMFGVLGSAIAWRWGRESGRLFITIYSWNVLAILALYTIYLTRYGVPYYIGGSDDLHYELAAEAAAQLLGPLEYSRIRGEVVPVYHNSVGYVYFLSLLVRLGDAVGGFHTLIPRLFNAMTLALLAGLVRQAGGITFGLRPVTAYRAGMFVGLAPIMMYNASHTFRDTIVGFLVFAVVYVWGRISSRRDAVYAFLVGALGLPVLWEFRTFSAVAAGALIMIAWWGAQTRSRSRVLTRLALLGVAGSALVVAYRHGYLIWALDTVARVRSSYAVYRVGLSTGLAENVFSATGILGAMLRLAYLAVFPFPVLTDEIERTWLSLGTVLQVYGIPYLLIGILSSIRRREGFHLTAAFLLLYSAEALLSFTFRHVTMFLPFAAVLAAYGYERYVDNGGRPSLVSVATTGALVLMCVGYLLMKTY